MKLPMRRRYPSPEELIAVVQDPELAQKLLDRYGQRALDPFFRQEKAPKFKEPRRKKRGCGCK